MKYLIVFLLGVACGVAGIIIASCLAVASEEEERLYKDVISDEAEDRSSSIP